MPFENAPVMPKRIAVIGGGISGMGAADLLSRDHQVTLFEAEKRLGGHARTVLAGKRGDQPVDTGFIVYNEVNYPHLTRLFADLDVPTVNSNMSFGASIAGGRLEYGLASVDAIFAQRKNVVDPRFLRMLSDINRFNTKAGALSETSDVSVGEFLSILGTGRWFREHYLLPFTGAIWSTPLERMLEFPAQALVRFMKNHGLMGYNDQHQWRTVQGGSVQYVDRLKAQMASAGVDIHLGAPIASVSRDVLGVQVTPEGGVAEQFDEVVFACHSDQALNMLADASEHEKATLGAVRYQPNLAVLHADASMMPKRRKVWSSWSYCEAATGAQDQIDLTYWMNSLQDIPADDEMFITLNSNRPIKEELIYDTKMFMHPVFDIAALDAQQKIAAMNGTNGTWFCGAWMKNGFHEDGLASAVDVADAMTAFNTGAVAA
ncbi:FAD-dependent oxidoreductase [uncultured Litoreibacter sp.]|uniref:NAD(P)/FAD-dependent oxidoreductase n=1 Tax=uncultured Litoreibacter sp. TaxID=1392394 RepID=UPI00262DB79A|nr:FAD-dependent oxidoreductase [uncultured Litoreibacter sp.]